MPEDVRSMPASGPGGTAVDCLDLKIGQDLEITSTAVVNQLKNVLRLRPGDQLQILNGQRLLFDCRVVDLSAKGGARVRVESRHQLPESSVRVSVALAVLKGERFDWALQKLTELGVSEIVPVLTTRSVVKLETGAAKSTAAKVARWKAIVREAAEQSERATIPDVVAPRTFGQWMHDLGHGGAGGIGFICAERISTTLLGDILLGMVADQTGATTGKTITLFVGPEGGFTPEEIELAQKQGLKPVSLGPRILRSETAAIYALAQVIWCLEK
jgi:16S rRNA (uracil1498-N3)-methyltransferase